MCVRVRVPVLAPPLGQRTGPDAQPACSKRVLGVSWPAQTVKAVAGGQLGRLAGEGDGGYAALRCVDRLVALLSTAADGSLLRVRGSRGPTPPSSPSPPLQGQDQAVPRGHTWVLFPHSGQSPVKPHEGRLQAGLGP